MEGQLYGDMDIKGNSIRKIEEEVRDKENEEHEEEEKIEQEKQKQRP